MKKLFASIPFEDQIFVVIPLFGIVAIVAYSVVSGGNLGEEVVGFVPLLFHYAQVGGYLFFTFVSVFFLFLLWKLFFWMHRYARAHASQDNEAKFHTKQEVGVTLRKVARLGVRILIPMLFAGILLSIMIAHISPGRIETSDTLLMRWDHALFGTYPIFWFQSVGNPFRSIFDIATPLFVIVYGSIEVVLGGLLLWFFLVDHAKLRIFVLSMLLNLFIAIPVWYCFPAIGPNDAFVKNGHAFPKPSEVEIAAETYVQNPLLVRATAALQYPVGIAITAFPSMHVAWATSAALVASNLHPVVGALVWAWWALNNVSTVYLLQHYAVDVFAGWVVALVSYLLARWIVKRSVLRASSSRVERFMDLT